MENLNKTPIKTRKNFHKPKGNAIQRILIKTRKSVEQIALFARKKSSQQH